MAPADAYRAISRELLIRYLDGCAPPLLHAARRLTYAEYDDAPAPDGQLPAVAALAVFAEFPELLAKRALHVVLAGADPAGQQAVTGARDSLGLACELHLRDGALLAALRGTGSLGTPVLAFVQINGELADEAELFAALAANPNSDVLAVAATGDPAAATGFGYRVAVELIAGGQPPRLLLFASNAGRHLDAIKDALWAVDEYAGVRYRDPTDPEHTALDISLNPGLGPLRRVLLAQLATGPRSVAGLREHTREQTIYRAVDAPRAVQALLHAGQARREPEHGRLGADTMIFPGR